MKPNNKGLHSLVSIFLVFSTIACSVSSILPSGGSEEPSSSSEDSVTQNDTPPVTPGVTDAVIPSGLPSVEQVAAQTTIPAGESGSTTAACPPDSLLLGGGFASGLGIRITKTMHDKSGWLVAGQNASAEALTLTAYAYCLHNTLGTTRVVSAEVLVSGFPRAGCPDGEIITGGGYAFDSDSLEVYLSTPDGDSNDPGNAWSVMARNQQDADQTISVYAVCLSGGPTSTLVRDLVTFTSDMSLLSFTMSCPPGAVMAGGGYEGTGTFISRISSTDLGLWEVQVQDKLYDDGSLDHAVCLNLP